MRGKRSGTGRSDTIEKSRSWSHLSGLPSSSGGDRTCVSPLGIWAQTNIVKQNIHKTSCTDNQHAQTLYYSHTKKNICANENVYTIQRFTDTYRQKNTGHQQNIQDPPIAETNQRDELHGQGGGQNSLTLGSSMEVLPAR